MKKFNKNKGKIQRLPAPVSNFPIEGYDPEKPSEEYTLVLEKQASIHWPSHEEIQRSTKEELERRANIKINYNVLLPAPVPSAPVEGYDPIQAKAQYTAQFNQRLITERNEARTTLAQMDSSVKNQGYKKHLN